MTARRRAARSLIVRVTSPAPAAPRPPPPAPAPPAPLACTSWPLPLKRHSPTRPRAARGGTAEHHTPRTAPDEVAAFSPPPLDARAGQSLQMLRGVPPATASNHLG